MNEQQANQLFQQAITELQIRNAEGAERLLKKLDNAIPSNPGIIYHLGISVSLQGRKVEAIRFYDRVIRLHPQFVEAYNNKGLDLNHLGKHAEAVELFQKAIQINPSFVEAYLNLGVSLNNLERFDEALDYLQYALNARPNYSDAMTNMACTLIGLQQFKEAEALLLRALSINDEDFKALNNLGLVYTYQRQYDLALNAYERCLRIRPNYPEAHSNLGLALAELGQYDQAFASYDKAIELDPSRADFYNNLGTAHAELRQFNQAITAYEKSIELDSSKPDALLNRSLAYLSVGKYEEGWPAYESRLKIKTHPRLFSQPLWLGKEDISKSTILLHAEQGLGDTLQFCRYVDQVSEMCANVFLLVQDPAIEICKTLPSRPTVISEIDALPNFDFHCPLMSLPLAFGTTAETIPANIPYLFSDPTKVAYWRARISGVPGLKIGLVWNGGFRRDQPKTWHANSRRNISLKKFESLPANDQINFFSLQKGEEAESELYESINSGWGGPQIFNYAKELHDYTDTAALIECLDLTISVDTSVAHLAGALGKPVWILNRYDSCWRWFVNRSDSPWYPSAKIFNQPTIGDWDSVIKKIGAELRSKAAEI